MNNNMKINIWLPFFVLLSFLTQSCQPLNTIPTKRTDNLSEITTALKRIQMEGSDKSYAIFFANEQKNYFVQVIGSKSVPLLHTEAVSNKYLEQDFTLKTDQINTLKSMGWNLPSKDLKKNSPNYFRNWEASTDDARLMVAKNLLMTLINVYGFNNTMPINIKMDLNP
jgi:hypothetical protein